MIREFIHESLCKQKNHLADWYCSELIKQPVPLTSSYDIRDSGFKITTVDANIYPAGFNNICSEDHKQGSKVLKSELNRKYGPGLKRIALLTEEHTQNPFYWDNIGTLRALLVAAGYEVLIGVPRLMDQPWQITSANGENFIVHSLWKSNPVVSSFSPQLILSNNDFSIAYPEWSQQNPWPIDPPRELGWYQRKKSRFFFHFEKVVGEFAQVAAIDPFRLSLKTKIFEHFDISDQTSMQLLATQVDQMLQEIRGTYAKYSIDASPVVFIKNNAGTYGLGVQKAESGQQVLEWNNKARKKMKAAKGGNEIQEVIIQEGVPTRVQSEGNTAEPVIYMLGSELAGGFLRVHSEKSSTESLNSPGSVYKKLCVSDLQVRMDGLPLENVYGWVARLGLLAIGREAQEMNVKFPSRFD